MTKLRDFGVSLDEKSLGFNPEELRRKYKAERDKRIRVDGNRQYKETAGDFSKYVDDPYADKEFNRAQLSDHSDVVIIGGGFGGLVSGARFREIGTEKIRIIEKGSDFGGTWYWNRYPGAMCDVESYIYLPLLEEMNYVPIEKYTHAPEILSYCKKLADHYDLYRDACLQTEVTEIKWDARSAVWVISTNRGDAMTATSVVMSNGPLNRPKLPGIEGINEFEGHTFHTSRWDYDYTGGSSDGGLTGLKNKRVGIIGTGATAVQCIPHLGASAKQLFVFQRTPSSIDVRNNRETDPEWVKNLAPGWQKRRMENFNSLVSGGSENQDMVGDGWTEIYRNLTGMLPPEGFEKLSEKDMGLATELADFKKMESIRNRVDAVVNDKETADALKPYYRQFCKRPCFHDEYLETYNKDNVKLIDTQGLGVDKITKNGVVVNGTEYELDCLIFATGFEVGTAYTRRSGYEVIGKNDLKLSDKWKDGPQTFHGMFSHGFPNCYFLGVIQSALTTNFVHLLMEQTKHIAHVVKYCGEDNTKLVEPTLEAEQEWVTLIKRNAHRGERFFAECTPGYYNNEGNHDKSNGFLSNAYGKGPVAFFDLLEDWKKSGTYEGLMINERVEEIR
jgi:cation diffusion facilitator CzcD-associated flavoprotein CzcO